MSHFPWKPLHVENLDRQIDRAFDQLIRGKWGLGRPGGAWQPEIDVYETDDAYIVEADLPGVPPEAIRVAIDGQWLTISGSRQSNIIEQSAHGVRIERRQGTFSRRFFLQHAVDPQHIQRAQREGTLRLTIPIRGRQAPPPKPNPAE